MKKSSARNPGPKPKTLKAEGVDWKDALRHALRKPKPPEGWGKACEHLRLSSEVICGQKTGDYVCSDCGESFTSDEVAEIRKKRADKPK